MNIKGFLGSAVSAGIKYKGRADLGLIFSAAPSVAAAVFTQNEVKAAPVIAGIRRLKDGPPYVRAILVNSGNANACTGPQGLADVEAAKSMTASALGVNPEDILIASTGVIGRHMPMGRIRDAIPALSAGLNEYGLDDVARSMLTTDTVEKKATRQIEINGAAVKIAGMAKGAGMIGPRLGPPQATMLAFILTDAAMEPAFAQKALSHAAGETFNRIIIDGDTSTNDTVFLLANGLAGNTEISGGGPGEAFLLALKGLMQELAVQIVADGEGVTKIVTVTVSGARSPEEADAMARTIAASPLVKTAFFGNDPNWGRVLAAAGRAGFSLDQNLMDIAINGIEIVKNGQGLGDEAEARAKKIMLGKRYELRLDVGLGGARASILTSDLSMDYVRINADYRT